MKTICNVLLFLIAILVSPIARGNWAAVRLDNRATIDFPVRPDSALQDEKKIWSATGEGCTFSLVKTIVKETDPGAEYLYLAYSGFGEGLNKREGITSITEKSNVIHGLPGKEFSYHLKESGTEKFASTRLLYFDGVLYALTSTSPDSTAQWQQLQSRFIGSFNVNTDVRLTPVNAIGCATDIDFMWGHCVFAVFFGVLAFTLYFIWTRNNPSRLT